MKDNVCIHLAVEYTLSQSPDTDRQGAGYPGFEVYHMNENTRQGCWRLHPYLFPDLKLLIVVN